MRILTIFYKAVFILLLLNVSACKQTPAADRALLTDADLLHRNTDQLTQVIIYDVFSPPVASRIYAYTSLAAYEALRFQDSSKRSAASSLHGFPAMPQPEKGKAYNYLLAATKAYFTVAKKVTFSVDTLKQYEDKVYSDFKGLLDNDVYKRSIELGEKIGQQVLVRTTTDNYKQTRGMPKFIGSDEPGEWRPTPPDYMDGAEPHWLKIKTLAIDSNSQFNCPAPPLFSTDTASEFYHSAKEVYTITTELTEEQGQVARYWDDNPFVMEHAGHLMFGNKKITPVGHWMGITAIACRIKKATPVQTAQAYALTSTAIFDAIISCWKTKYQYRYVRPITFINQTPITVINAIMDQSWQPLLQTPPFPEYPSGHSGISAAAATVLTKLFGDDVAFEDTSDLAYIGMKRSFSSFRQAAAEASISRVYGGIHYRTGINAGAIQGQQVGKFVIGKFLQ